VSDAPTRDVQQSFYASALTEDDRALFDEALAIEGLADEIALLRLRVRETLGSHADDAKLIEGGVRLLIQSLLAQHRLSSNEADNLSGAISNVGEEFGDLMRGMTDV
jgi:hypothetical protein